MIQSNGPWTERIARNVSGEGSLLTRKKYLIYDRDSLYTKKFDSILKAAGGSRQAGVAVSGDMTVPVTASPLVADSNIVNQVGPDATEREAQVSRDSCRQNVTTHLHFQRTVPPRNPCQAQKSHFFRG